jgi:flavin-dependent dehydrogenase
VIEMAYDAIVVGARVAGSSTAMLLARRGLRVLVLDQTSFPSDTLSSHQLQPPGVALLRKWGLLERIEAAGTPATRAVRFHATGSIIDGDLSANRLGEPLYSPRRTVLDPILVTAAREAGAEFRERARVTDVVFEDGRAVGVLAKSKGGGRSRSTPASSSELTASTRWSRSQPDHAGTGRNRPGRSLAMPTGAGSACKVARCTL